MTQEEYTWKRYIKDCWYLLQDNKVKFTLYSALRSTASFIPFIVAYYIGTLIDFLTNYSSGDSLNLLYMYVGLIAFFGAFTVWLRMSSKKGMKVIAANVRKNTRLLALKKLIFADMDWHESEDTGSKIQKINSGSDAIFESIHKFSNEGINILIGLIASLTIFFVLDLRYVLFSIFFIIIYLLGEKYFNKKLSYLADELQKTTENVSGKIHESTSNILTVKSLGLYSTIHNKTEKYEDEFIKIWTRKTNISQLKFKTIKMFAAVMSVLFILIIGLDVINGIITVGAVYMFISYFEKLRSALSSVTNKMNGFISVKSRLGRLMTILNLEIKDESDLLSFPTDWKEIEFRDVSFKYKSRYILDKFNFKIHRNTKLGLVGRSGSGKSTIIKLLIGLYKPSKGQILVDGVNIQTFNSDSIRDEISVVLQDSEVFNMSLYENLTLIQGTKNDEIVKNAIQIAELQPIIKKLPRGIDTMIGEKGYQMSGGERQRLGIARTLCKNSSMIIFDEATSALDSKTESKIQHAFDTKLTNKTTLTIAHRLSTLKSSDIIIFLKNGKLIESGTFDELLKKKEHFYNIYKLQNKT